MMVFKVEANTPPVKDFDAFPSTIFRFWFETEPGRCRPAVTRLFKDRVNFDKYATAETGFVLLRDKETGKAYIFGADVIHTMKRKPDYSSHDAVDKFLALMFGGMDRIKDRFEKVNQGFLVPLGKSDRDPEAGIVYQITELRGTTTYGSEMGHHVAVTPSAQRVKSAFQQELGIYVRLPDRDELLNTGGEAVYNHPEVGPDYFEPKKVPVMTAPPRARGVYEGD